MKFSIAAIVGALAAAVLAKPSFTNTGFEVKAGQSFTLTWTNASGPVELKLVNGPDTDLKPVLTIASGLTGNSYTWTPPSSLVSDTYAFEIDDSTDDPNWSLQFEFVGTASATTSASSTKASSSTSSSATSASTTSSSASSSSSSASVTSSSTTKSSSSATTSASKTATTTPTNTNNGQRFASPLALVLVTFAALICFN